MFPFLCSEQTKQVKDRKSPTLNSISKQTDVILRQTAGYRVNLPPAGQTHVLHILKCTFLISFKFLLLTVLFFCLLQHPAQLNNGFILTIC